MATIDELVEQCDLIITTTPARQPLLEKAMFRSRPPRIVAVGADAAGKQEIATDLTAGFDILVADSLDQCVDHGEIGWVERSGLLEDRRVIELGSALAHPPSITERSSVLVDLTGLGIQDLMQAKSIWEALHQYVDAP